MTDRADQSQNGHDRARPWQAWPPAGCALVAGDRVCGVRQQLPLIMLVVADNQVARDLAPSVVVKIRPLLAAERAACADPAWAHDDEQVWQEVFEPAIAELRAEEAGR